MKTFTYYPEARMLAIIDEHGYVEDSYAGPVAERKFMDALGSGGNVHLVDGSFKMKLKPAGLQEFLDKQAAKANVTIVVKKGGAR